MILLSSAEKTPSFLNIWTSTGFTVLEGFRGFHPQDTPLRLSRTKNQEPSRPRSHHHERHHQLLHLHPRTERTASSFVSMTPFDQKNLTFEQTQQKRCLDSIFLSILGVMKNQVPFTVGFSGVAGGINHQLRLGFQKNIWAAFRFPQKHLKLDLPLVSPCWP